MRIQCRKCKKEFDESEVELHHIIPRSIGGTDKDGRAYLCKKCHNIWHYKLPKLIWRFVPESEKELCRAFIKVYFGTWLK